LKIRSCFLPKGAWTAILLFYASHHHWDDRHASPSPAFIYWNGLAIFCMGLSFFFPGLAWSHDPPNISLPHRLGWQVHATHPAVGWNGIPLAFFPSWLKWQSSQSQLSN
jgi:hypothetical protein